jgi:hypothetical protein
MGGSKRAAQNVEQYIRANLPGAVSARSGKKRAPLRDVNWSRTPAEEIRDMMGTTKGRETLSGLSAEDKKIVRTRLSKQNRLWADQFDDAIEGSTPGGGYNPKKDAPKRLDSGKERAPPKGGNDETDMSDRAKESVGRKLKREGERNETADVRNTGSALRGTKEARAAAEKPLPNPRERKPVQPAEADALDMDPVLQRGNAAGSTPGSETIAVEAGTKPLPKGVKLRASDDIDGLGEPETFVRDEELDPNETAPKRKARTVTAGEGDRQITEKVSEPETRARGTRVWGKGKGTKVDGDLGKQGGRSDAYYRSKTTTGAAGFNPNAADSGKRLSADEVADAKVDFGSTYKRMEGRSTQPAESRIGLALKSVRKNYPEEGDAFLALIADADSDEAAYEVAYRLAEGAIDNDNPGVRISETARADAVHGMAAALVRGNGREIPTTMPRYVAELDDAARQADVDSGHITDPTKAPVEPGPDGSVRDFLRNRARTRFRPDADGRPKVGAETADDGFGRREVAGGTEVTGPRAPTAGSTDPKTLSSLPPIPGATRVRTKKGKPSAAAEPGVNPAALEGSEDAQPVWADRTALRKAGSPLPPKQTKAQQKAAAKAAKEDDGLAPIPEGGVKIPPRGKRDPALDAQAREREMAQDVGGTKPVTGKPLAPRGESTFDPNAGITGEGSTPGDDEVMAATARERQQASTSNKPPRQRRAPAGRDPVFDAMARERAMAADVTAPDDGLAPIPEGGVPGPEGLGRDGVDDDPFVPADDSPDEVPVWQRVPQPNGNAQPGVSTYDPSARASSPPPQVDPATSNPWVTSANTRAEYHGATPEELGRRAREAAANQPPPRPLDARGAGRWVGENVDPWRVGGGAMIAAGLLGGGFQGPGGESYTGPDAYTLSDGPVQQQPQQADLDQILQAIRQMQGARNSIREDVPVNRRVGTYGYANNGY